MFCAEWWADEVLIIVAGTLGVAELAAATIMHSMYTTLIMIPLGVQEATSALIGNCIGANNVTLAKRFNRMNSLFAVVVVVSMALFVGFARNEIPTWFTTDEEVIQIATMALLI